MVTKTQTSAVDSASEQAALIFAREASELPGVAAVAAAPGEYGVGVWTVLAAEDADHTLRRAVYELERSVWERHPSAMLDFRVINAADYPGRSWRDLVHQNARWLHLSINAAA